GTDPGRWRCLFPNTEARRLLVYRGMDRNQRQLSLPCHDNGGSDEVFSPCSRGTATHSCGKSSGGFGAASRPWGICSMVCSERGRGGPNDGRRDHAACR